MKCPLCSSETKVCYSEVKDKNVRRRRRCVSKECDHRFTTRELAVVDLPLKGSTMGSDILVDMLASGPPQQLTRLADLLDRARHRKGKEQLPPLMKLEEADPRRLSRLLREIKGV